MNDLSHLTDTQKTVSLKRPAIYALAGLIVGFFLFFIIYGYAPLVPTNVSFLYNSPDQDVMSHQFGFDFYRYDSWQHPIGLTDRYPYPYTSSIINSDSIPIMAVLFKLLSPLLPEYFQYFGLWILLCFMLQGLSAALLLRQLKIKLGPTICALPLFICNVPLLFRCFHHSALAAQWLILLCFLLILNHSRLSLKKNILFWSMLCGLSVWIHGYLFIMVGLLMTLNCIYYYLKNRHAKPILAVFFSCVFITILFYYEGGGFIVYPDVPVWGLGLLTFDPIDLLNPTSYSAFFPAIKAPFSTENAAYLGIGIIILLIFSVALALKNKGSLKTLSQKNSLAFRFCLFSILLIILLSFGVCARFAGHSIYDLRPLLSEKITLLLSNFRSSARFIWPVWYLILLVCLAIICHFFKSERMLCVILVACVILQCVEIVPITAKGGTTSISGGYNSAATTAFESCYSQDAKHLSFLGPTFIPDAAVLAAHHNMSLNASKVGRGLKNSQQIDTETVRSGQLRSDTIYVLPLMYAHYIYPANIPEDYRIFYCADCLYISASSLVMNSPGPDATEISPENLTEISKQLYEAYGEAPAISSLDDI